MFSALVVLLYERYGLVRISLVLGFAEAKGFWVVVMAERLERRHPACMRGSSNKSERSEMFMLRRRCRDVAGRMPAFQSLRRSFQILRSPFARFCGFYGSWKNHGIHGSARKARQKLPRLNNRNELVLYPIVQLGREFLAIGAHDRFVAESEDRGEPLQSK